MEVIGQTLVASIALFGLLGIIVAALLRFKKTCWVIALATSAAWFLFPFVTVGADMDWYGLFHNYRINDLFQPWNEYNAIVNLVVVMLLVGIVGFIVCLGTGLAWLLTKEPPFPRRKTK